MKNSLILSFFGRFWSIPRVNRKRVNLIQEKFKYIIATKTDQGQRISIIYWHSIKLNEHSWKAWKNTHFINKRIFHGSFWYSQTILRHRHQLDPRIKAHRRPLIIYNAILLLGDCKITGSSSIQWKTGKLLTSNRSSIKRVYINWIFSIRSGSLQFSINIFDVKTLSYVGQLPCTTHTIWTRGEKEEKET